MGSILDATILHHVCFVLLILWFLNSYYHYCHPVAYFLSLVYLYLIHEGYVMKLRKKLQFEERRDSYQRRVLSDSETVRWLNHAIEKIWPICMEEIVSQKILLPVVPWFLDKYKPWTVKDAEVQHLYLGRSPPIFTDMRVLQNNNDDDHLVMELGMNFRTADDMSAILGVKLRKRVGLGMWAKLHLLGLHVEGKVLVGVKFLNRWPFIGRLRVSFAGPPYFEMTVKPVFTHGLDVTELPGIAGWIDNLLALVFEQTLVEPNMLVVDVEKFVSPEPENWFCVDAKDCIAQAVVEVIEAAEMNPSDLNGLADPYVKGQLGPYRFRTKTKKKTLTPKWLEEFKIPICTWEPQNMLVIQVRDKDHLFDDMMGDCSVNINELRDGQRHDIWLPLQNIKMGRLHLAVTVFEGNAKVADSELKKISYGADSAKICSFTSKSSEESQRIADKFEPIKIEGQSETGIWIQHPGSEVVQEWEPRKGKGRHVNSHHLDGQIQGAATSGPMSTDENTDANKSHSHNPIRKGWRKVHSLFHRRNMKTEEKSFNARDEPEPSPRYNIKALNTKEVGVRLIVDDKNAPLPSPSLKNPNESLDEGMTKSILKQTRTSARNLKLPISKKASKKSKSGLAPTEKNHDSSDDEAISSSVTLSRNSYSFKSTDDTIQTTPWFGNNSFKSADSTIETPRDSSIQTPRDTVMQATKVH
ncbi:hypothetical protein ACJIZ3_007238 [Penstemon smallii]|uniref:C2 domain-containing protein n=1 Tax=Penstemon smallii TaxID=265156 RepID=A0ABD3S9Y6_9LAMI